MHKKYVHFKRDLNRRKRAAQNSAERRVDREGWGKAETQSEHLPLSKKHSQGKQSACFSAEEEKRLQGGWVRRGRRRSSEKAKAESFECGSAASGRHKKFRPPPPKLLHSFVAKAQKRQREYFCFCAWFFSTAVGYR